MEQNSCTAVTLALGRDWAAYIVQMGPVKLKTFGYLAFKSEVTKKHWPINVVQLDSYVVPAINNWSFSLRSGVDIAPPDKKHPTYWGEDFLGYQLGNQQSQVRTEWKYQNEFSQTPGLGYSTKMSAILNLAGYIGVNTKEPFDKSGWIAINKMGCRKKLRSLTAIGKNLKKERKSAGKPSILRYFFKSTFGKSL